ncbi:hypothetical protein [Corynebacterium gerontici]|uniref:Uncharacterized protein n=1 Tax=Corynebacterium gerontici TaxID=2079234 RepID=A0A3G6J8B2_9CORY|nr:hypothetical protein [Corynebacterium gerontici]AZA12264.1 hypothetical protein CGERO_09885 [Corynebacterium gerontici]
MFSNKTLTLFMAALSSIALPLAACSPGSSEQASTTSSSEQPGAQSSSEQAQEQDAPQARVAVATEDGITIFDGNLQQLASFDLPARPTLSTLGDHRHIAAVLTKNNAVEIIDAGSWSVPHGDHSHYYTTEPSKAQQALEGAKPIHVVSNANAGTSAIFFDDDAEGRVLDAEKLEHGQLDAAQRIKAKEAHHGVVVPLANDQMLVSQKGARLADTITLLDADGETIGTFDCSEMHGEDVHANNAIFGCSDGVLEIQDGKPTMIPAPDASGERVGAITFNHDASAALGDWGEESLLLIREHQAKVVPTPAAFGNRISLPEGGFAYLDTEGVLHILDDQAVEQRSIPVMGAWTKPKGHGGVAPGIAAGENGEDTLVWVSDPKSNTLYQVNLSDDSITHTDVEGAPASLAAVG